MKFMFGLQHPLTCKPWTTLSNPCNKERVKYVVKEVLLASFITASLFLRLLSLRRYVSNIYMCISAWISRWQCNKGSSDLSTETDTNIQLAKVRTAIHRLSVIWKSDLTDKMKRSFFQAAIVSILLYGCTSGTLTKRMKKKLEINYTRMLQPILTQSWRQHPTKQQLYGHQPPITKTIQVRQTRHVGHGWRSRDELISDILL